jgi:hypothetical protein
MLEMGEQQTPARWGGAACAFNAEEGAPCRFGPESMQFAMGRCRDLSAFNYVGLADYLRDNRVPRYCIWNNAVPCLLSDGDYRCGPGTVCWGSVDDAGTNGICVPLPCNR